MHSRVVFAEVLSIPISPSQSAWLDGLDVEGLERLTAQLRRDRAWPA